jgi:hypothetical protein
MKTMNDSVIIEALLGTEQVRNFRPLLRTVRSRSCQIFWL